MRYWVSVKPSLEVIFCVEPHISIHFTDIKYFFFYLDNLLAPGHPAPELEVKALIKVKLIKLSKLKNEL